MCSLNQSTLWNSVITVTPYEDFMWTEIVKLQAEMIVEREIREYLFLWQNIDIFMPPDRIVRV